MEPDDTAVVTWWEWEKGQTAVRQTDSTRSSSRRDLSGPDAHGAAGRLTAWLSVQFCMPGRHHEVAGRWRDTWRRCAWGHSPCRGAPPDRCTDQLKDTQEAHGCEITAEAKATASYHHVWQHGGWTASFTAAPPAAAFSMKHLCDWFSEASFSALLGFFFLKNQNLYLTFKRLFSGIGYRRRFQP